MKLNSKREEMLFRTARTSYLGAVFSLAFCLVLVPWAVRNYRVFHFFQPLSPAHAEMPGEFVPRGYFTWVRTWIDDARYIDSTIWLLDAGPIKLTEMPDRAFDSPEEKQRVGALLEKYNHASEEPALFTDQPGANAPANAQGTLPQSEKGETGNSANSPTPTGDEGGETNGANGANGDEDDAEGDDDDQTDEGEPADASPDQSVEMTPEIDAGFAQIARERIARHPLRYYVWLPLRRAHALWFDTHSEYYPFQGQLLPLDDLDYVHHQQYWLPLFAGLTLVYSLLGIAGGWFLWQARDFNARLWVLLAALMIFLRVGFFSSLENPEPRYVVEVFPFLAILGGIAVTRLSAVLKSKSNLT
jgi:hypothetical protein